MTLYVLASDCCMLPRALADVYHQTDRERLQIKGLSLDLQSRDGVIQAVKSNLQDVTHVW
jgi:hypothetical protein